MSIVPIPNCHHKNKCIIQIMCGIGVLGLRDSNSKCLIVDCILPNSFNLYIYYRIPLTITIETAVDYFKTRDNNYNIICLPVRLYVPMQPLMSVNSLYITSIRIRILS